MAKQTTVREISKGICHFCQGEFAKSKMTQHLKTCKVRATIQAKQFGLPTRLFHILVEGTYRPSYWLHLELPVEATLSDLDDFLRDIWLECCDHLSEFTIHDISYGSSSEDDWFGGLELLDEDEDEEDEEEEEIRLPDMQEVARQISQSLASELHADLKDVPVEEIEKKLEQMFVDNLPPGMSASTLPVLKPLLGYMASALQEGTLAEELEELESLEDDDDESGMDVELGKVLSVGDKFSYVYDFGSSTNLSLRVIAEREGVMLTSPEDLEDEEDEDEEDEDEDDEEQMTIIIMAQNEPPSFVCRKCGKPATHVSSLDEFDSLDEAMLCTSCAQKEEYPDELLPVVNSPRVGVCGYTGDEYEDDEEWDDWEEEDNEEKEE
jgi:hypothetical protein